MGYGLLISCAVMLMGSHAFSSPEEPNSAPVKQTTELVSASIERFMGEAEYTKAESLIEQMLLHRELSADEKVQLFWLKGICAVSLGNEQEAHDTFVQLKRLSPGFKPSELVSPKVLQVFEEAKAPVELGESVLPSQPPLEPQVSIGSKPSFWNSTPLWLSVAATAVSGIILASVLLSLPKEHGLEVVVHTGGLH